MTLVLGSSACAVTFTSGTCLQSIAASKHYVWTAKCKYECVRSVIPFLHMILLGDSLPDLQLVDTT